MPNFQEWSPPPRLAFTLQSAGRIRLSHGIWESMGEPKHLILLYDTEQRIVGLRPPSLARLRAATEPPLARALPRRSSRGRQCRG